MIYSLIEYSLNCLNGTFFDSADSIIKSRRTHTSLIPHTSIYIAFIGINTLDISVILSQTLLLYSLFHKLDMAFTSYFHSDIPLVPIFFSFVLQQAYISPVNKCRSLLSRILYSTIALMTDFAFSNIILRTGVNFITNFLIVYLFDCTSYKFYTTSLLLSFCGTYFFFKTYKKAEIFTDLLKYDVVFDRPEKKTYILFTMMMISSLLIQITIGRILLILKPKYKRS